MNIKKTPTTERSEAQVQLLRVLIVAELLTDPSPAVAQPHSESPLLGLEVKPKTQGRKGEV